MATPAKSTSTPPKSPTPATPAEKKKEPESKPKETPTIQLNSLPIPPRRQRNALAATPSPAAFQQWQQQGSNAQLMDTAEKLLDKLEDTAELLTEIDQKYVLSSKEDNTDAHKMTMIQRFHNGLDSARELVHVLQTEKWRLSKREMSVEIRIGELAEYKNHLKSDMSTLNQTVDALSIRVVQLENQLVEAQEVQENLEHELQEHRNSLHTANEKNVQLYTENRDLQKKVRELDRSTVRQENQLLKDELQVLTDENRKLKDMVRDAEALASPLVLRKTLSHSPPSSPSSAPRSPKERHSTKEDTLMKLTKEFLQDLSSLDLREDNSSTAGDNSSSTAGDNSSSTAGDNSSFSKGDNSKREEEGERSRSEKDEILV